MKKKIAAFLTAGLLIISGCGETGAVDNRQGSTNAVDAALQSQMEKEDQKNKEETNKDTVTETTGAEAVTEVAEQASTEGTTIQEKTEAVTEAKTAEGMTEAVTEAATASVDASTGKDKDKGYLSDPDPSVDVDLTVMGKDMVYATVYDMMAHPDDYVGKVIKAKGVYTAGWFDGTERWYHYCLIEDAAACCQQGLEFTWDDGNHDLSEFPADGTLIEVEGVFEIYKDFEDDPYTYCQLADASMVVTENEQNQ